MEGQTHQLPARCTCVQRLCTLILHPLYDAACLASWCHDPGRTYSISASHQPLAREPRVGLSCAGRGRLTRCQQGVHASNACAHSSSILYMMRPASRAGVMTLGGHTLEGRVRNHRIESRESGAAAHGGPASPAASKVYMRPTLVHTHPPSFI